MSSNRHLQTRRHIIDRPRRLDGGQSPVIDAMDPPTVDTGGDCDKRHLTVDDNEHPRSAK